MSGPIDRATIEAGIAAIEESERDRVVGASARVRETSNSWLALLTRPGEREPAYCLKVRKPDGLIAPTARTAEQLPAALEYEMTVRVREHMSHFPRLRRSVVRPVGFLACGDVILTEYASGASLKDRLPWLGPTASILQDYSRLREPLETCGAWLAQLHRMRPPDWLPIWHAGGGMLERRTRASAAGLPQALQRLLPWDEIALLLREWDSEPHRMAVSHGDFHPGNILLTRSQVTILDLGAAGIRPIEDDLAFFVTLMFTHKRRIVFGNLAASRVAMRQLCERLIRAYGMDSRQGWHRLRPLLAAHAVERLGQMSLTVDRTPRIARPFLLRRLVGWVKSELPFLLGVEKAVAAGKDKA